MRGHNSTIQLKQKSCIRCGKPCIWFSKKRCQECARIEDALAKDSKETIKTEDLNGLIEDADALFSRWIRLKYSDKAGIATCYTCGTKKRYHEMQGGHYISRK